MANPATHDPKDPGIPTPLVRTPLFDLAVTLKARMTAFGGWEMPVQYSGIGQEHQAVRQQAGMFDISHMGKFRLKGANLIEQLQALVPSDLGRLEPGAAQYTVLLNSQAGIIDDVIFYYQGQDAAGEQRGILIVNAATTLKDRAWLSEQLDTNQVELVDCSLDQILIAVQGPQAANHLQNVLGIDLSGVKFFGHLETEVKGRSLFLARTGYTGEDGFEVMLDPEAGQELWRSLLAAGVVPCGLGARDTLRLEAALGLYGQDMDETTTPLEAGLGWLVHLDRKGDFIGREILEHQKQSGVQRRLVGLQMQGRHIARHDYPVIVQGQPIGTVTSGTLSPTLGYPIALAYVPPTFTQIGQTLEVQIRGNTYTAEVVKRPFYRRPAA